MGCWTRNHSKEEREASHRRYKSTYYARATMADFAHFLIDYEGYPDAEDHDMSNGEEEEEDVLEGNSQRTHGNTAFFTTTTFYGKATVDGPAIFSQLRNQATHHAITQDNPREARPAELKDNIFTFNDQYSSAVFQGIMPDTGAAQVSTAGHKQYLALCRHLNIEITLDTSRAGEAGIRFGSGESFESIGAIKVPTPLGKLTFHVMTSDTPFLFCLKDMDRFGHPSVQRLHKVLQRAGHETDLSSIEAINKFCRHCQLNSKAPGRFKFTLRDNHKFNHKIIPVLHVVDAATSFNAARFLRSITAEHTWEALRMCWIDVYLGPPDWITTDAGLNFHAAEFKRAARSLSIEVKEVPIEAHHSIGRVERYYATLRRAYDIIRAETGAEPDVTLQLAVKAINDTAGLDGLVPTLLVFGAYPRITDNSPLSATITQRAETVKKAMEAVRQIHAKRQVNEALATRNGLNTSAAAALPLQSKVCV
ncbi:hypothetical protein LX36DRAFT_685881 [Colletotrichum falcatum]|nr:hypothetical protein LX36DRAFT_685881 [Colletotrichum falcatum]